MQSLPQTIARSQHTDTVSCQEPLGQNIVLERRKGTSTYHQASRDVEPVENVQEEIDLTPVDEEQTRTATWSTGWHMVNVVSSYVVNILLNGCMQMENAVGRAT